MRKFTDRDHQVLALLVIRPFIIKCLTSQTSRRHKRRWTGIKRHTILFDCHRGFAKIPYHTRVGARLITTGLLVMAIKIIALALVCGLLCGPVKATGTQIWLAGVDPVVRAGPDAQTASDYLNLFQPDAPWVKASEAVQVFKTSARFLANASDETLSRMFADLRRRHIALGMEALMLTVTAKCGAGIEGYSSLQAIAMVVSRIKRLGADLDYVAMDEPLEFGHYSQLPNACQSTLADIANDVAVKVRAVRQIYPNVQVGDIEGIGLVGPQSNIGELMEWTRYYQSAVGTPLSFLHVDVLWSGPWKPQLQQLAARCVFRHQIRYHL